MTKTVNVELGEAEHEGVTAGGTPVVGPLPVAPGAGPAAPELIGMA